MGIITPIDNQIVFIEFMEGLIFNILMLLDYNVRVELQQSFFEGCSFFPVHIPVLMGNLPMQIRYLNNITIK